MDYARDHIKKQPVECWDPFAVFLCYVVTGQWGREPEAARDVWESLSWKIWGNRYPGIPLQVFGHIGVIRMPAPGLGEHNRLILEQWLGYTSDEVQKLYKKGTIL